MEEEVNHIITVTADILVSGVYKQTHNEEISTVDLTVTTFVYSIKSISCLDVVFNYSVSQKMKLSHTLPFF